MQQYPRGYIAAAAAIEFAMTFVPALQEELIMESTALRLGERDAREREVFLNARTPTSTQLATYRTYVVQ